MKIILALIIIYLYASIPFSLLVGFAYGKDIRKEGSGNVGGSNLGRSCGKLAFVFGFIGDMSKGAFAILISSIFGIYPILAAAIALLGHTFPIFNKFKGGKGVATAFGFVLAYTFWGAIFAITVFLIVLKISKYVSLSAIIAIGAYFLYSIIIIKQPIYSFCIFLVWAAITYLHKENIKRIKNKEERKITWM